MHTRRWTEVGLAATLTATILLRATRLVTDPDTIAIIGTSASALLLIHRWLNHASDRLADVTQERRQLAALTAQAEVGNLANVSLRTRMRAELDKAERAADDRAAEAEAKAEQRIAEHAVALRREYEENRTLELCKSYELGALGERSGSHNPQAQQALADLILLSNHRRPNSANRGTTLKTP